MADVFTREKRSRIMSSIKGRNTKPEIIVRRSLHAAGYRFRVHAKNLPGKPDIYFSRRRKAVFVNGCFWHGHEDCRRAALPKTNRKFWRQKIDATKDRDVRKRAELAKLGIRAFVVWECELKSNDPVMRKLTDFLGSAKHG